MSQTWFSTALTATSRLRDDIARQPLALSLIALTLLPGCFTRNLRLSELQEGGETRTWKSNGTLHIEFPGHKYPPLDIVYVIPQNECLAQVPDVSVAKRKADKDIIKGLDSDTAAAEKQCLKEQLEQQYSLSLFPYTDAIYEALITRIPGGSQYLFGQNKAVVIHDPENIVLDLEGLSDPSMRLSLENPNITPEPGGMTCVTVAHESFHAITTHKLGFPLYRLNPYNRALLEYAGDADTENQCRYKYPKSVETWHAYRGFIFIEGFLRGKDFNEHFDVDHATGALLRFKSLIKRELTDKDAEMVAKATQWFIEEIRKQKPSTLADRRQFAIDLFTNDKLVPLDNEKADGVVENPQTAARAAVLLSYIEGLHYFSDQYRRYYNPGPTPPRR